MIVGLLPTKLLTLLEAGGLWGGRPCSPLQGVLPANLYMLRQQHPWPGDNPLYRVSSQRNREIQFHVE